MLATIGAAFFNQPISGFLGSLTQRRWSIPILTLQQCFTLSFVMYPDIDLKQFIGYEHFHLSSEVSAWERCRAPMPQSGEEPQKN